MKISNWLMTLCAAIAFGAAPLALTGCDDNDAEDAAEDVGDSIEEGVEEVEDEIDDAT